ncbi:MAG: hypothetical protein ABI894_05230 [Ilumatobacteraceae bacterium]
MTDLPPPAAGNSPVADPARSREAVSAAAAERLAALRKPSKERGRPALAAKILVGGLSTTAMFGLVTYMGWPQPAADQGTATAQPAIAATPLPTVPTTAAPTTNSTPAGRPTTVPPVTIPVAVPVEVVPIQVATGSTNSNITTKTSG